MTASVTSLIAHRALTQAERLLAGPRLTVIAGSDTVGDVVPVPAEVLRQLVVLARGATEIADNLDAIAPPTTAAPRSGRS